jgi:hypothetical protein
MTSAAFARTVLMLVVAGVITGCGSKNAYVPPPAPKVVVAQPLQQPVTLYLNLTGNTAPFRTVTLVARVQGYLESIDYQDGAVERCSSALSATSIRRSSIKPKRNWRTTRRCSERRKSI